MRKIIFFIFLLAIPAFTPLVQSQVSINTNLTTGTMTTGIANLYRTAYLHFQLVNCGDNTPIMPGTSNAVVQDSFDLHPATPGSAIVGQIVGNDQITCGNVVSSYYVLTPMKDASHPLRDGEPFVICSAAATLTTCGNQASLGTFNLITADPMQQPPPIPGYVEIYGNPTNDQTINQPINGFNGWTGLSTSFTFTNGLILGPVTTAELSALTGYTNAVVTTDSVPGSNPCTGGGTGALAVYVDATWSCAGGSGGGGVGTINDALQFSTAYYSLPGSADVISGLPAPTGPNGVPQVFGSTPSGGVATAPQNYLPGIAGRAGIVSDTLASTDCNPLRVVWTGSTAATITLATPTALQVPYCSAKFANNTSTTVTIAAPGGWTVSKGSGGSASSSVVLAEGQEAVIFVDPITVSNFAVDVIEQGLTAGSGVTLTRSPTGVTIAASGIPYLPCQTGLGDGLNAIPAGTYLQSFCFNDSGASLTITGIRCSTDNSGSSTLNVTDNLSNALLTGAITCSPSWAAGTQSAHVTILNHGFIEFTFVADGTSKQTSWAVTE